VPDTTPLTTAVARLADRLRALPESALRRGAEAQGRSLARELAYRAQRLEFPEAEPLELPDAGPFAVGDQLAVAGHDLVAALREVDAAGAAAVPTAAGATEAAETAREFGAPEEPYGPGPAVDVAGEIESALALVERTERLISGAVTSRR